MPLLAEKKIIQPKEFAPGAAFNPAVLVDGTLYVSGQTGRDLKTQKVKPCSPNSRRYCSSIPCGVTFPACRNKKRDGSPERAIPLWEKALDCYMAASPPRGPLQISLMRWAFPDPRWWSG